MAKKSIVLEIRGNVLMKFFFDYYFFVLLRCDDLLFGKDRLSYHVPGAISSTLAVNIFSLAILFDHHILEHNAFWIFLLIISLIGPWVLDTIYTKERREKLREKYNCESFKSRRQNKARLVIYGVISILLLVLALSLIEKPIS